MSRLIVTDFGARGDGSTLATGAIQRALDEAARSGGGVVSVPPGVYLTGTIHLRSRVTLELLPGSRLKGSGDLAHYPEQPWGGEGDRTRHHLIAASGVEDAALAGGGVIDGSGPSFWLPRDEGRTWTRTKRPRVSPMIEVRDSRRFRVEGVTVTNSPGWTMHLFRCRDVWVRGIRMEDDLLGPNTDGIDVTGCRDVTISDCHIECGDDAVCLKTYPDSGPCERVAVTNCVIRTNCVALKVGNETWDDFRSIAFSNCVIHGTNRAIGLYMHDGRVVEDVVATGIVCDTNSGLAFGRPIHVDVSARGRPDSAGNPGAIRNVTVSSLIARTDGRVLMTAADGGVIENVTLADVRLTYPCIEDPGEIAPDAKSHQFSNRSPEARSARAAVVADGLTDLVVRNLAVDYRAGEVPARWKHWSRGENGSDRRHEHPGGVPPAPPFFHALWGRRLRGGFIDSPMARAFPEGAERYRLDDCDIAVRA